MKLYHRTDAAQAILASGFRDATGSYMLVGFELTGVWLADQPLDVNEGAKGGDLLEVAFPGDLGLDLDYYEVVEEGKPYREWCVPAALINEHAAVRLLSDAEEDDLYDELSRRRTAE